MRKASSPQFATAREAVLALPSRARVLVSQACGAPMSLLQALADERDHFQALELCTGVLFTDYPILPCISENITLTTWQVSAPVQALADQGKLEYLPLRLSQVPKTFPQTAPCLWTPCLSRYRRRTETAMSAWG